MWDRNRLLEKFITFSVCPSNITGNLKCILSDYIRTWKSTPLETWTGPQSSKRLRLQEFLESRLMKVARLSAPRTGRLYPPRKTLVLISVTVWVDLKTTAQPEGQWKIPSIPSGNEPSTFQLVTQCFNKLCTAYHIYLLSNHYILRLPVVFY
jgi:hypothetical protein